MNRFRIFTVIFVSMALLVFFLPALSSHRIFLLPGILILYMLALVYGAASIRSQFFIPAFYRGKAGSRKIALTFDDGPFGERSEQILNLLKKHNSLASFFLIGKRVEEDKGTVKKMINDGHLVGNHSYSHSNFFPLYAKARIRDEVERTNELLEEAGAEPVRFFRPPFGVTNPRIAGGLKDSGLVVAGWSIRTFDTRNQEADRVLKKVLKRMNGGDIILLHETSEYILEILEQLLPAIREAGFTCVRLDDLLD